MELLLDPGADFHFVLNWIGWASLRNPTISAPHRRRSRDEDVREVRHAQFMASLILTSLLQACPSMSTFPLCPQRFLRYWIMPLPILRFPPASLEEEGHGHREFGHHSV